MQNKMQTKNRFPFLTALCVVLITIAVALPGSSIPDTGGIPYFDKFVHFMMFACLAIAIDLDFKAHGKKIIFVFIFGILFSAATEALQIFIDDRSAEIVDMIADISGFTISFLLRKFISPRIQKLLTMLKLQKFIRS